MDNARLGRRRGLFAMVGSLLWVATVVLYWFTGGGGSRGEAVLRTVLMNPALLFFIVGLMGGEGRLTRPTQDEQLRQEGE